MNCCAARRCRRWLRARDMPLRLRRRAAFLDHCEPGSRSGSLDEARLQAAIDTAADEIAQQLRESLAYSLRPVINATGVILHTNLGRAPLSRAALEHVAEVAQGYSNLELDLATGERGKRDGHVDRLFARLFG